MRKIKVGYMVETTEHYFDTFKKQLKGEVVRIKKRDECGDLVIFEDTSGEQYTLDRSWIKPCKRKSWFTHHCCCHCR